MTRSFAVCFLSVGTMISATMAYAQSGIWAVVAARSATVAANGLSGTARRIGAVSDGRVQPLSAVKPVRPVGGVPLTRSPALTCDSAHRPISVSCPVTWEKLR